MHSIKFPPKARRARQRNTVAKVSPQNLSMKKPTLNVNWKRRRNSAAKTREGNCSSYRKKKREETKKVRWQKVPEERIGHKTEAKTCTQQSPVPTLMQVKSKGGAEEIMQMLHDHGVL